MSFQILIRQVLGVTVCNSDNEAAVPRRELSHGWDCQSPEIVWENSEWKKANCFQTEQKTCAFFPRLVRWNLMGVAPTAYQEMVGFLETEDRVSYQKVLQA